MGNYNITHGKNWTYEAALQLFNQPFFKLIDQARATHKQNFNDNKIQVSALLSIKTGKCPEDCAYCPQSAHYDTGVSKQDLMPLEEVLKVAKKAQNAKVTRFCMGAAWRNPSDNQIEEVCKLVKEVKKLGLETCVTLGMLKYNQAKALKEAGLDYYNHNVDTSEAFYDKIITTRTFQDRIDTINLLRKHNIKVCCGGILGMGETNEDRVSMLVSLANLLPYPESLPLNKLIKIPGTPLENVAEVSPIDFVRTVALARILMPKTYIRLAAGRGSMADELQILCFMAGVNSVFYGEKLFTASNMIPANDKKLFEALAAEPQILE